METYVHIFFVTVMVVAVVSLALYVFFNDVHWCIHHKSLTVQEGLRMADGWVCNDCLYETSEPVGGPHPTCATCTEDDCEPCIGEPSPTSGYTPPDFVRWEDPLHLNRALEFKRTPLTKAEKDQGYFY